MLTGFGYVANVDQTPHALLGIRLFFGVIPAVCIFVALPFLFKYPLTRKAHAEVRAQLQAMDAAAASDSPVAPTAG
jgi:GPH family glycoside/pentoside/hexuronide:cation symporter